MCGVTYFRRWGFSINEGAYPNIHVRWRYGQRWGLNWYIALSPKLKWWRK